MAAEVSSSNGTGENENEGGSQEKGEGVEYEFTGGETQLLRICMDAMHTAGLALIVQGVATGLLGTHTPCVISGIAVDTHLGSLWEINVNSNACCWRKCNTQQADCDRNVFNRPD